MRNTFIYILICPITNDIKYVGKSNNPKLRFYKHLQMVDRNHNKNKWILYLKSKKLNPILSIIDEVLVSEWKDKEKFYISKYREMGFELFNTSIGGEGLDFGNQTSFKPGDGSKKVVCLYTDGTYKETFNSTHDAAKHIGKHNISSALKGVTKKAGGYIWIYEYKYNKMSIEEISSFVQNCNHNKTKDKCIYNRGSFKKGHKTWNKKEVHQYTIDNLFIKSYRKHFEKTLSRRLK